LQVPSNTNITYNRELDGGNFYKKKILAPVLQEAQNVMACPYRAAQLVCDLNIPVSRYHYLSKPPMVMGENHKFVPATVEGVPLPSFHAPTKEFEAAWHDLKEAFVIQHAGTDESTNSYSWNALDALKFLHSNPAYKEHIQDPNNLELIVRGDGFPVGGKHAIFLIMTLGNFGVLGKSVAFNIPLNLAEVSEKNHAGVRAALAGNLNVLAKLSEQKTLELFPGVHVNVRVEYGGDESWLRMLLGLLSSSELMACLKCIWLRDQQYDSTMRVERNLAMLCALALNHEVDSNQPPLISNCSIWNIHSCAMHAIMAYGKDLLQLIFTELQKRASTTATAAAMAWLHKHNINANVEYLIFFDILLSFI
jgi:hypothetical protein